MQFKKERSLLYAKGFATLLSLIRVTSSVTVTYSVTTAWVPNSELELRGRLTTHTKHANTLLHSAHSIAPFPSAYWCHSLGGDCFPECRPSMMGI